jgi:hypothetical protein
LLQIPPITPSSRLHPVTPNLLFETHKSKTKIK